MQKSWEQWRRVVQGVLASAAVVAFALPAAADECGDDAECPDGYVCETQVGGACPEIAIDCAEGMPCPAPPDCQTTEVNACVPAPCASDADCGDSLVCFHQTWMQCSSGGSAGCPRDEECEPTPPPVPECETVTESFCAPRWIPPCEVDADCGPGFRCVEEIERGCTSSAGRPPSDGTPVPPPPPPSCFEHPTGRFMCELIELPCSTDDDCESGLTCQANPNSAVCDLPVRSDNGDGDGDEAAADPAVGCGDASEPTRVCLPPNYASDGRAGSAGGDREEQADSNGTTTGLPRADSGFGNANPDDEGESAPKAAEDPAPRLVRHGCSAAGANPGGWLSLTGWLLLAGVALRRRRRG